ncbi:MAG: methyltransferase domain-containing protein [bacterium]
MWRIDLALARSWALGRAFTTSLAERPGGGARGVSLAYGETPWPAIHTILTRVNLAAADTFVELGSGTGRFALFAARLTGCRAIGIELVPSFVTRANAIARGFGLERCEFRAADFFDVSWREAAVVYCATTTFDEATLARFDEKCGELELGARVVTVTQPPRVRGLALEWMDVLDFSWGPGTVFVHRRGPAHAPTSR